METSETREVEGVKVLLKNSIDLYKKHWKVLSVLFIIPTVLSVLASTLNFTTDPSLKVLGIICLVLSIIVSFLLYPAGILAIARLAGMNDADTGSIGVFGFYKKIFPFIIPVIILIIFEFLAVVGGLPFLLIPGIVIAVYSSFAIYALLLNGKKGLGAMEESFSLTRHNISSVIWRMIVIGFLGVLAGLVFSGPIYLIGSALGIDNPLGLEVARQAAAPLLSRTILTGVFSIISTAIVGPITAIYTYRVYLSLVQIRKSDVSTTTFRKVCITFIVIAVLLILAAAVIFPVVAIQFLNTFKTGFMTGL